MRIICCAIFLIVSCTKKEETWGPIAMWNHAKSKDPSIELVAIPNHEGHRRILCSDYPKAGCVVGSGKRVKVRLVELIVLQYETVKHACLAARGLGQWYARNWLLDDVTKEPVLESFVKDVFNAKRPKPTDSCD